MARPRRRLGNLPAEATSFVGRRLELADLKKRLGEARLVSLIGPGGVGKTRLAIHLAGELGRSFRDGTWFVELADVRDPTLVSNALMSALDLRDQAGVGPLLLVLAFVREKQLLLVVDNCEHLLEASAQVVSDLVREAPGVRILATSREPLSAFGEHVVPVAPLILPPADGATLAQLHANEAIELFAERAAAATGAFELGVSNQAAVIDICRRLDGLPLAIELAAVRTRTLGVEQIRDRLNDRFGLLTAGGRGALPRHQTLRTAIDWSYDLLGAGERVLFRRLCVFAGRFMLEDVAAVCADDVANPDVLDVLSSLVDKSLIVKEDVRGRAAYRLHETMREYAALKLAEADEADAVQERRTSYYVRQANDAGVDARFRLPEWLEWMELEIDNVRAVLGRCVASRDSIRGIDLVAGVGWYWITRATSEGVRWLDALLESGSGNPDAQFWAYFLRGFLAVLKADPTATAAPLEAAVRMARDLDRPELLANALSMASIAANLSGDPASARRLLDEAAGAAIEVDDHQARIAVLQARVLDGYFRFDVDAIKAAASEGVTLSRAAGDYYGLEMMLLNLGGTALLSGDFDGAKLLYVEALRMAQRIDDRIAQYALLDSLACVSAAQGEARLAANLLGAAETVRTQAGASVIPFLAVLTGRAEETAVAAIGRSKFDAEVHAGKGMDRIVAIHLALGERVDVGPAKRQQESLAILGKREADVARLVAEGLSNKQIGTRLFISERTVDSHVRTILNKLGFDSRTQIASWVSSSDQ